MGDFNTMSFDNKLTKEVTGAVAGAMSRVLESYNKKIATKFSLDLDEVSKFMSEVALTERNVDVPATKKPPVKRPRKPKTSESKEMEVESKEADVPPKPKSKKTKGSSPTDETKYCKYVITKGKNVGQCTTKPSKGADYCGKHSKMTGKVGGKKATPPVPSENVLRLNKAIGLHVHKGTGFAFKSASERVVVGKVVNDTLVDLDETDIETCKTKGFMYTRREKEVEPEGKEAEVDEEEEESEDEEEEESEDEEEEEEEEEDD